MKRIKELEESEAKDGEMHNRKRFQYKVDRIQEAVRQKNFTRCRPQAPIGNIFHAFFRKHKNFNIFFLNAASSCWSADECQ